MSTDLLAVSIAETLVEQARLLLSKSRGADALLDERVAAAETARLASVEAAAVAEARATTVAARLDAIDASIASVDAAARAAPALLVNLDAARLAAEMAAQNAARTIADAAQSIASGEELASLAPPATKLVSGQALRVELGRRQRMIDDFRTAADVGWSAALSRAVAALPPGSDLWLREVEYDAPETVVGLHDLRLRGPGALRANGSLFRPSPMPTTVNTIFVSPTGDDSADGLSPTRPIRTPARAAAILRGYGPILGGRWRVQILAAATYSGLDALVDLAALQSALPIFWTGPTVAAGAEPQVVIDGIGGPAEFGWRFERDMSVALHGLRFRRWTKTVQSCAVAAFYNSTVGLDQCWLDDNNFGVQGKFRCQVAMTGGRATNNERAISAYGSSGYTIGSPTVAAANGPLIQNNRYGLRAHEGSKGHADNARWYDNTYTAIWLQEGARATVWYGGDFRRNGCNVSADETSEIAWDASVDWHSGDADRSTKHMDLRGGGVIGPASEPVGRRWRQIDLIGESITTTGTLAEVVVASRLIGAQRIAATPHAARMRVRGYFTGAGLKTIRLKYGGQAGGVFTSFANAADTFELEGVMMHSGAPNAASQRWSTRGAEGGNARGIGVDPTLAQALEITVQNADATGSTVITMVEIEINN
jgi:hypothetical protein